jgi:hypothetical protein
VWVNVLNEGVGGIYDGVYVFDTMSSARDVKGTWVLVAAGRRRSRIGTI